MLLPSGEIARFTSPVGTKGASVEGVIAPYIFNVYVQNHRLNPDAEPTLTTWSKGQVSVDHIGIWDTGGVDFDSVFEGLSAIGYAGYVTVHQAFGGIMSVTEAVTRSHEFLTTYSGGG